MGDENKLIHKKKSADDILSKFKAAAGSTELHVGFLRSSGKHKGSDNLTVAAVAYKNEYGDNKTPERSFMRSTMHSSRKKITKMLAKLSKAVLTGSMSEKKAMSILGMFLQTEIRKSIDSNVPPPNAPSTIARKGSDHTLIDTHQMHDSVDFEVVKGKG